MENLRLKPVKGTRRLGRRMECAQGIGRFSRKTGDDFDFWTLRVRLRTGSSASTDSLQVRLQTRQCTLGVLRRIHAFPEILRPNRSILLSVNRQSRGMCTARPYSLQSLKLQQEAKPPTHVRGSDAGVAQLTRLLQQGAGIRGQHEGSKINPKKLRCTALERCEVGTTGTHDTARWCEPLAQVSTKASSVTSPCTKGSTPGAPMQSIPITFYIYNYF